MTPAAYRPVIGGLREVDEVAHLCPGCVDRADGEFQHPMRAADERDEACPRAERAMHAEHGSRARRVGTADEHRIDREAHEHHVDAVRLC